MILNVYVIDASSMIALNKIAPISVFSTLWKKMEDLIGAKRLVSPEAVLKEIERKDDELKLWACANRKLFKKRSKTQMRYLRQVLGEYPHLSVEEAAHAADALIVALALELANVPQQRLDGAKNIVVVTEELVRGNRVKIPLVCKKHSIDTIPISGMFKAEGWRM